MSEEQIKPRNTNYENLSEMSNLTLSQHSKVDKECNRLLLKAKDDYAVQRIKNDCKRKHEKIDRLIYKDKIKRGVFFKIVEDNQSNSNENIQNSCLNNDSMIKCEKIRFWYYSLITFAGLVYVSLLISGII